ncbi:MAG: cellulase family glycosylhydrolase [Victivallales bacterium]|nr:cellulase family glycosylhydrolase [Victivallales bacterium]
MSRILGKNRNEKSTGTKEFLLGVNYWPRRTGVRMWKAFDTEELDREFAQIRQMGMNIVRVFPLWDDFQPIKELLSSGGVVREIGFRESLGTFPADNPYMLDESMLEKFDIVVETAKKYQLKLIVALMTVWMSGTLFDLSWRNGRNIFSDPFMIKWAMLYVRAFAKRYRGNPNIYSWEFGNEQNCVTNCPDQETAWVWMQSIVNELKLHDDGCRVSSGMHALTGAPQQFHTAWNLPDSGQIVDIITTHPYPDFTSGCNLDRLTSMRGNLHAAAQGSYYAGLSGKPVLCEETGSLGESILSRVSTADFVRLRLHSLLANGDLGCIWWCYSDFLCADELPYSRVQMENDGLGLTDVNGILKPAGQEFKKFSRVVNIVGGLLPETEKKAAILVRKDHDSWEMEFNAFVLCKQAGIEADFVYPRYDLSKYDLLICPSLAGHANFNAHDWRKLLAEVELHGKTLYLSWNGGSFTEKEKLFGIIGGFDRMPAENKIVSYNNTEEYEALHELKIEVVQDWFPRISRCSGKILMNDESGSPTLIEHCCGKGTAVFCALGIEKAMSMCKNALNDSSYYRLYEYLRNLSGTVQEVSVNSHELENTWHKLSGQEGILSVINYSENIVEAELHGSGMLNEITAMLGNGGVKNGQISIPPLQAELFKITLRKS